MRKVNCCRERRAEIARAAFPDPTVEPEEDTLSQNSEEIAMHYAEELEDEDKQLFEANDDSDASETVAANLQGNPFAIVDGDNEVGT